jgi:hypothetical protein
MLVRGGAVDDARSISPFGWTGGAGVVSGAAGAADWAGAAGAAGAATVGDPAGRDFLVFGADFADESGKIASPPGAPLRPGLALRWRGWSEPGGRRSASVGILALSSMVWTY